ncbi:hypothetical protein [Sphingomicrobium sediminis]|uniref:Uncharacterized protein n=1 Tax=Sphingomicrobium sediminis TaxID=2950949 RepID=A0A9X2EG41_9SPHN|nr:hypothetical protein [Sphingomicrobium sediminis]MCM8556895.1 hypothetical protein [Sphingomicrobium sediminis]
MIEDPGAERRAQAGVDGIALLLLGRWLRFWGFILGATFLLGMVEDQLMPIFYIALAFAGIMLIIILATRRMISSKLSQGRPPIIETEAREVEIEPDMIDITPEKRDQ